MSKLTTPYYLIKIFNVKSELFVEIIIIRYVVAIFHTYQKDNNEIVSTI